MLYLFFSYFALLLILLAYIMALGMTFLFKTTIFLGFWGNLLFALLGALCAIILVSFLLPFFSANYFIGILCLAEISGVVATLGGVFYFSHKEKTKNYLL